MALKRLLEIVNGRLAQAGSSERLYAISSGKDGGVMLLTPAMHEYIERWAMCLITGGCRVEPKR